MCNRYLRAVALGQVQESFSYTGIPLLFPEGLPNLAPTDISITDIGTIIRASGDEPGAAELVQRRWSWPGPTGKPLFNYRSDHREFATGRCLIVATGFYEYTDAKPAEGTPGKGRAKERWLFTKADEEWFCIAGIWRKQEEVGEAFTMLTTPPGPDTAPYHNRQPAVLDRSQWAQWLTALEVKNFLGPLPQHSLNVRACPQR